MDKELLAEANHEYRGSIKRGMELCTTKMDESLGDDAVLKAKGYAQFFSGKNSLEEGKDFKDWSRTNQIKAATSAIIMENTQQWLQSMDETTRSLNVGGFVDYLFPMIRAAFTNNPVMDLVSVQPMTRSLGRIFFLNYVVGQTKGSRNKGDRVFDATRGYTGGSTYTGEQITGEVETSTTASTTYTGQLSYLPARRGTVTLSIDVNGANLVATDAGNGTFTKVSGTNTVSSSSIDYNTGIYTITAGTAFSAGLAVSVSYLYDSEVSTNIPQVDFQITSTAVQAIRRALRVRYSTDGAFDFKQEFGEDADVTLTQGVADLIRAEVAREVVGDLWSVSGSPVATFSTGVPSGVSKAEHFADIKYELSVADNAIFDATQRAHGSWMICDIAAASVIRTIPAPVFVEAPLDNRTQGVQFIGKLNGIDVWVDRFLTQLSTGVTDPTASSYGNILMGHKGTEFWDAGYVYAPYQPLISTVAVTLDDFVTRKGLATRYAKKIIQPQMYKRIALGA
jgi:Major capsid protein Gp23